MSKKDRQLPPIKAYEWERQLFEFLAKRAGVTQADLIREALENKCRMMGYTWSQQQVEELIEKGEIEPF